MSSNTPAETITNQNVEASSSSWPDSTPLINKLVRTSQEITEYVLRARLKDAKWYNADGYDKTRPLTELMMQMNIDVLNKVDPSDIRLNHAMMRNALGSLNTSLQKPAFKKPLINVIDEYCTKKGINRPVYEVTITSHDPPRFCGKIAWGEYGHSTYNGSSKKETKSEAYCMLYAVAIANKPELADELRAIDDKAPSQLVIVEIPHLPLISNYYYKYEDQQGYQPITGNIKSDMLRKLARDSGSDIDVNDTSVSALWLLYNYIIAKCEDESDPLKISPLPHQEKVVQSQKPVVSIFTEYIAQNRLKDVQCYIHQRKHGVGFLGSASWLPVHVDTKPADAIAHKHTTQVLEAQSIQVLRKMLHEALLEDVSANNPTLAYSMTRTRVTDKLYDQIKVRVTMRSETKYLFIQYGDDRREFNANQLIARYHPTTNFNEAQLMGIIIGFITDLACDSV